MKVRFYCDIPSQGVRLSGINPWHLHAMTHESSGVLKDFTRVAFDVEMPSHLVVPEQDVVAHAGAAVVVQEAK